MKGFSEGLTRRVWASNQVSLVFVPATGRWTFAGHRDVPLVVSLHEREDVVRPSKDEVLVAKACLFVVSGIKCVPVDGRKLAFCPLMGLLEMLELRALVVLEGGATVVP
jgi:hypothetical protein